jgi:hypothetical protein
VEGPMLGKQLSAAMGGGVEAHEVFLFITPAPTFNLLADLVVRPCARSNAK